MNDKRAFELLPVSGRNNVWYEGGIKNEIFDGKDTKHNLLGTVGSKEVLLVERNDKQGNGCLYSEQWKIAKAAGLPVVPTLRKTKNGKVLMTDLTADGSEVFGKAMGIKLKHTDFKPKLFKVYLEVLGKNEQESTGIERIIKKVKKYADIATEHGLALPYDDPFELVLHPDGTWDLFIFDLEQLRPEISNQDLQIENQRIAEYFIGYLQRIQSDLLSREK